MLSFATYIVADKEVFGALVDLGKVTASTESWDDGVIPIVVEVVLMEGRAGSKQVVVDDQCLG